MVPQVGDSPDASALCSFRLVFARARVGGGIID